MASFNFTFFPDCILSLEKWQKKLSSTVTFALTDSAQWLSTEPTPGGYSALIFTETHTCLSKNKSSCLNASSFRFLPYFLVNTAQMWQLEFLPRFLIFNKVNHDDVYILFFSLHFFFNSCTATPWQFLACLTACVYWLFILIPSFLHSRWDKPHARLQLKETLNIQAHAYY